MSSVFVYNEAFSINSALICLFLFGLMPSERRLKFLAIGIFPFFVLVCSVVATNSIAVRLAFNFVHCNREQMHQNERHVALWTV